MTLFLLELLSWRLVLIIEKVFALKYLIVQRIFLFIGIYGALFRGLVLILAIFIKMGLPPFHFWFVVLARYFKKWIFFVILTLHKLLPILLLTKIILIRILNWTVQAILMVRGISILQVRGILFVFLVSSLVHSGWLLLRGVLSLRLVLFYWVNYSILIMVFLDIFKRSLLKCLDVIQTRYRSIMWLVLSGIPPFTMFWLKLNIFIYLRLILGLYSLVAIIVSVIRISSYYRAYHLSLRTRKAFGVSLSFFAYVFLVVGVF